MRRCFAEHPDPPGASRRSTACRHPGGPCAAAASSTVPARPTPTQPWPSGATALPATTADSNQQARRSHVEISAEQYDSPGRDDGSNRSLNKERVEITNDGRRAVNLEGWTLADEDGHTFTSRHYRLRGHESVRVHTGEGPDRDGHVFQDRRHYAWDNPSDTATLRHDNNRRVDDAPLGSVSK
ncbi:lamin tail domain-containing protein [Streptomyces tauricus]|uniref:lamin tail domain-containing protein n=1 Tax=Streptomyces tauricus TaxID=68274 RepID=UPI0033B6CA8A